MTQEDLEHVLSPPDVPYCHTIQVDIKSLDLTSLQNESSPPLKTISKNELSRAQSEDAVIGPVFKAVSIGERPNRRQLATFDRRTRLLVGQWKGLSVEDGVLIRKTSRYTQIVLPTVYHDTVYKELHVGMGHLSSERVEDLARQRYYWPHMTSDIEFFVRKKCSCVFTKAPNVREKAKLVPIEASYPFEVVSVDFLQLSKCKGGYEYVLVVCDHFTRFSQAYATKRKSARAAAEVLFNKFILTYGFPTRIHHDRGGEWNNHLFTNLHKLANIKASNTTPYHPMGDPIVERYNRTLINMLKAIPENEKKRWVDHLPKLCFAYNSTVHKATGYSPFFLLFGRQSRLRIDGAFPSVGKTGNIGETTYTEFATNWKRRMDEAFKLANQNSQKGKHYHKGKYDDRANAVEIGEGDRVLVQNCKPATRKLSTFWDPDVYVVVRKRGELPVYELRKYGSRLGKVRVLHRNLLKRVNDLAPPEGDVSVSHPQKKAPNAKNQAKTLLKESVAVNSHPVGEIAQPESEGDVVGKVGNECLTGESDKGLYDSGSETDDDGYFVSVYAPAHIHGYATQNGLHGLHSSLGQNVSLHSSVGRNVNLHGAQDVTSPGSSTVADGDLAENIVGDQSDRGNGDLPHTDGENGDVPQNMPELEELGDEMELDDVEVADSDLEVSQEEILLPNLESDREDELCELVESDGELEGLDQTISSKDSDQLALDQTLMDSSTSYDTASMGSDSSSEYSPNNSFNSTSDSPPPPRPATMRRSTRTVVPPMVFTYDKVGTPAISRPRR